MFRSRKLGSKNKEFAEVSVLYFYDQTGSSYEWFRAGIQKRHFDICEYAKIIYTDLSILKLDLNFGKKRYNILNYGGPRKCLKTGIFKLRMPTDGNKLKLNIPIIKR